MNTMKHMIAPLAALCLFAGCAEEPSTTTTSTLQFSLTGQSQEYAAIQLQVRHIELDLPAGLKCDDVRDRLVGATCGSEDNPQPLDDSSSRPKIVISGPLTIDMRAQAHTVDGVVVPDLAYERVDVRLEGRNGYSIAIEAANGDEHLFDFNEDIRFESSDGVRVTGGPIMVEFDTDNWLRGVNLEDCEDADACDEVEDQLKENLKRSGRLR